MGTKCLQQDVPCNLQNCFLHTGKRFIFEINVLMIAKNDATNKVCVVDAVVLFFSLFLC